MSALVLLTGSIPDFARIGKELRVIGRVIQQDIYKHKNDEKTRIGEDVRAEDVVFKFRAY